MTTEAKQIATPPPAGSITRRLVYATVLLPIVPSMAVIGVFATEDAIGLAPYDELRWYHLFFSILWVVATVCIWRRAVIWTLGRKWLTALVGLVPFLQVSYGQPLWNIPRTGCIDFSDTVLRVGQHHAGIGLTVWLTIWVWWGWEKRHMSNELADGKRATIPMTQTAKRLAASIGSIPFVFGAFFIINVAIKDFLAWGQPEPSGFAATAVVAVAIWVLIWHRAVAWTPLILQRTAVIGLLCLALPVGLTFPLWNHVNGLGEVVVSLLPVIGWGLWMALTIRHWPMASAEATGVPDAPRCLACGYSLIGLYATRCPECGDQRTLDELWQANTGI